MRTCFVDYRITKIEEDNLRSLGVNIIKIPKHPNLYEAIEAHPDIQLNILDENSIIVSENPTEELLKRIPKNFKILKGAFPLELKYPKNVYLNAVNLKETFIHNTNFTDPTLLKNIKSKKIFNIKQGYAKCSIAVVSEKALITSDKGIYNALKNSYLDILLIPSGDISLPGLDYGFIGGTCGLISETELAFFGNLEKHPYGDAILAFLKKHGVKPIYLSEDRLVDRGSIITI